MHATIVFSDRYQKTKDQIGLALIVNYSKNRKGMLVFVTIRVQIILWYIRRLKFMKKSIRTYHIDNHTHASILS